MFGLDDSISSLSDGSSLLLVMAVGIVLGLRHATDPDHVAAVTTLIASRRDASGRRAGLLGLAWGGGHALTLFAFGAPIVLFRAYLPERVQQGTETMVGLLVIGLAVWLLVRWRRGVFHVHAHAHGGEEHQHVHSHRDCAGQDHPHAPRSRSPLGAFGIGCVHGVGGSAGVAVLLVAAVDDQLYALVALTLLAAFTAVSMTLLSCGFGLTLARPRVRRSFHRLAPVVGASSLGFGGWYVLGALHVVPYVF